MTPTNWNACPWSFAHSHEELHRHTLLGHINHVGTMAVLDDGVTLVSGSEDGSLRVWDLNHNREVKCIRDHNGPINSLAVTPDEKYVITGSDDSTVGVFRISDWKLIHSMSGHSGFIREVAALSGDRALSAGEDSTMRLWDLQTGQQIRLFEGHKSDLSTLAVSPDESRVLTSALDNTIFVWDLATGSHDVLFEQENNYVRKMAGALFFSVPNNSGRGHKYRPTEIHFLSDSLVATASEKIIIWNLDTKEIEHQWNAHAWPIGAMALSPDGRWLAAGARGVKIWNTKTFSLVMAFSPHEHEVMSLAFTPDSDRLLVGSKTGIITGWQIDVDHPAGIPRGHIDTVAELIISPRERVCVSAASDGSIAMWNPHNGEKLCELPAAPHPVASALAFSPDESLLWATTRSPDLAVFEMPSGRKIFSDPIGEDATLEPHALAPLDVGRRVLVGVTREGLYEFDLGSGESTLYDGYTKQISGIITLGNDKLAVTTGYFAPLSAAQSNSGLPSLSTSKSQLQGWDIQRKALMWTLEQVDGHFSGLLAAGDRVVVNSGHQSGGLDLINPQNGELLHTFIHDEEIALVARLATHDRLWATAVDRKAGRFSVLQWNLQAAPRNINDPVSRATFDIPNVQGVEITAGGRLAIADADGMVVALDLQDNREIWRFESPEILGGRVVATRNGDVIFVRGKYGRVHTFR